MERTMSGASELVFVVAMTSFTSKGFTVSSTYEGRRVDIEFNDGNEGLSLSPKMCRRIDVEKGSGLTILVEEDEKIHAIESVVHAEDDTLRFANPGLYYLIGRTGGGVLVVRKA